MTKDDFKKKLDDAGDAVITYRSKNSRRLKYNICTRDFSTPYIKEKKNRAKEAHDTVLLFCWDTDSYRLLMPKNVTSIVPLNRIIKNDWFRCTKYIWKSYQWNWYSTNTISNKYFSRCWVPVPTQILFRFSSRVLPIMPPLIDLYCLFSG